jgi:hypothetical protein
MMSMIIEIVGVGKINRNIRFGAQGILFENRQKSSSLWHFEKC